MHPTTSGSATAAQANKAQLSATVSSQTENIRTGLELVAKSKQTLLNLQRSFRVRLHLHSIATQYACLVRNVTALHASKAPYLVAGHDSSCSYRYQARQLSGK